MLGMFPAWMGTCTSGDVQIVKEYIEVPEGNYGAIPRIFVRATLKIKKKETPKIKVTLL